MIYIYHHLGLGDHILCNGLVREIAKNHDKVFLFCKRGNIVSVWDMFIDEPKISLIPVEGDVEVTDYLKTVDAEVLRIGYCGTGWSEKSDKHFDEVFYDQAGLPFEKKYESFYIKEKQKIVFLPGFIFLHEDKARGYTIDRGLIKSNLPIITPDRGKPSMFDYIQEIKEAEEIHCIDSAFLCLVDILNVKGKKYFHKYSRNADHFSTPCIREDWIVL